MKKIGSDRASVIEEALSSFEWLYRLGIWLAFSLTGMSFLFWAGLGFNSRNLISLPLICLFAIPLKKKNLALETMRGLLAIAALIFHLLTLQGDFSRIPSVLLIIPAVIACEIFSGWLMQCLFIASLWSIQTYWVFGGIPPLQKSYSSIVGAAVSIGLMVVFRTLQNVGKQLAAKDLEGLRGRNDFNSQRIHASRLQVLGELSAALVHELSNPFTNLQGFFSQLLDGDEFRLTTRSREISARIEANLTRVRDLLLGFKSFSRMQPVENMEFKLSELLADLNILARHAFDAQKVELTVEIPSTDVEIRGNRVEIGQVMMNFLLNALAAVKTATVKQVRVGYFVEAGCFALYVEDSGVGVNEHIEAKIFRPFFSTKGDEGSGLGLYISKIIAEHHECRIEVKRALGTATGGARFELIFPRERLVQADESKAA